MSSFFFSTQEHCFGKFTGNCTLNHQHECSLSPLPLLFALCIYSPSVTRTLSTNDNSFTIQFRWTCLECPSSDLFITKNNNKTNRLRFFINTDYFLFSTHILINGHKQLPVGYEPLNKYPSPPGHSGSSSLSLLCLNCASFEHPFIYLSIEAAGERRRLHLLSSVRITLPGNWR